MIEIHPEVLGTVSGTLASTLMMIDNVNCCRKSPFHCKFTIGKLLHFGDDGIGNILIETVNDSRI